MFIGSSVLGSFSPPEALREARHRPRGNGNPVPHLLRISAYGFIGNLERGDLTLTRTHHF